MPKSQFDVLKDKIVERLDRTKSVLCSGGAVDYPMYRELCGDIRGLDFTLAELETLLQSYEGDEDDI